MRQLSTCDGVNTAVSEENGRAADGGDHDEAREGRDDHERDGSNEEDDKANGDEGNDHRREPGNGKALSESICVVGPDDQFVEPWQVVEVVHEPHH